MRGTRCQKLQGAFAAELQPPQLSLEARPPSDPAAWRALETDCGGCPGDIAGCIFAEEIRLSGLGDHLSPEDQRKVEQALTFTAEQLAWIKEGSGRLPRCFLHDRGPTRKNNKDRPGHIFYGFMGAQTGSPWPDGVTSGTPGTSAFEDSGGLLSVTVEVTGTTYPTVLSSSPYKRFVMPIKYSRKAPYNPSTRRCFGRRTTTPTLFLPTLLLSLRRQRPPTPSRRTGMELVGPEPPEHPAALGSAVKNQHSSRSFWPENRRRQRGCVARPREPENHEQHSPRKEIVYRPGYQKHRIRKPVPRQMALSCLSSDGAGHAGAAPARMMLPRRRDAR